jgi:hypothetical protein
VSVKTSVTDAERVLAKVEAADVDVKGPKFTVVETVTLPAAMLLIDTSVVATPAHCASCALYLVCAEIESTLLFDT